MAVLDPSATQFSFRSYLSFGPAHLFQHLLAKFGVIVAPGAVSWIHGPLLPSPGWSRKGKFKQALLAFPESSWYWISSTKALHCKKTHSRTYARLTIFWGLILLNKKHHNNNKSPVKILIINGKMPRKNCYGSCCPSGWAAVQGRL